MFHFLSVALKYILKFPFLPHRKQTAFQLQEERVTVVYGDGHTNCRWGNAE